MLYLFYLLQSADTNFKFSKNVLNSGYPSPFPQWTVFCLDQPVPSPVSQSLTERVRTAEFQMDHWTWLTDGSTWAWYWIRPCLGFSFTGSNSCPSTLMLRPYNQAWELLSGHYHMPVHPRWLQFNILKQPWAFDCMALTYRARLSLT